MPSLWQHIRGRLDRSKSPVWGWRFSLLYGMGVWTMLGFLFLKWVPTKNVIQAVHSNVSPAHFNSLSEEEKDSLMKAKNLAVLKRQQELAEYVAENLYVPVDFIG